MAQKRAKLTAKPVRGDGRRPRQTGKRDRVVIAIGAGNGLTRPPKAAERVARAITRDIIRDGRQPGDPLPSEATMLEQYDVSRESLREALRLLEVQGLVAIRRGPHGGPSVCTVDPANLGRVSTLYYHLAGATYRELWEAWILAESILAERAASNPDDAARTNAMAPYVDAGQPSDGSESLVNDHIAFHAAVASLTQNRVLEIALQTMGQIVSHHFVTTDDPRPIRSIIHDDHRQLARLVSAGDAHEARAVMEAHTRRMADIAGNNLGTLSDDFIEWQ